MEFEDYDNRILAILRVRDQFPASPSIRIIAFHAETFVAVWDLTVIHLPQLLRILCFSCLICRRRNRVTVFSTPLVHRQLVVVSYRRVFLRTLPSLKAQGVAVAGLMVPCIAE